MVDPCSEPRSNWVMVGPGSPGIGHPGEAACIVLGPARIASPIVGAIKPCLPASPLKKRGKPLVVIPASPHEQKARNEAWKSCVVIHTKPAHADSSFRRTRESSPCKAFRTLALAGVTRGMDPFRLSFGSHPQRTNVTTQTLGNKG